MSPKRDDRKRMVDSVQDLKNENCSGPCSAESNEAQEECNCSDCE